MCAPLLPFLSLCHTACLRRRGRESDRAELQLQVGSLPGKSCYELLHSRSELCPQKGPKMLDFDRSLCGRCCFASDLFRLFLQAAEYSTFKLKRGRGPSLNGEFMCVCVCMLLRDASRGVVGGAMLLRLVGPWAPTHSGSNPPGGQRMHSHQRRLERPLCTNQVERWDPGGGHS